MRMLVGRSMRKWRWCLVKCAMACKPCKRATCRGSLMIAPPVQREIASGHLDLCALLISPCNSSPSRNLNVLPFEEGQEFGEILRDKCAINYRIIFRFQIASAIFFSPYHRFSYSFEISIYFEVCNKIVVE